MVTSFSSKASDRDGKADNTRRKEYFSPLNRKELLGVVPGTVSWYFIVLWNILRIFWKDNETRRLLSTLVWAVQHWFTQWQRNVPDRRRHMKFIFSIAFKPPLGFGVQPQCQKKSWHLDRRIKICREKSNERHRNKGPVECMCSFNLVYMFPPSFAVRAPRCAANETPLSGYSSWKAEHEKYNILVYVRVYVCVRG